MVWINYQFYQIQVERHFLLETGFRAVYETAPQPHVVILVEMDALPEIGHACGHNLIAESSVATGLGVLEIMKKCKLSGKLTLLGTPAEERGGGKIKYVTEGFFSDVTAAIMSHPSRDTLVDRRALAVTDFLISYRGKAAHAAVAPWEGVNALDAAVMAYQSVSCLRQQVHPDSRIHGIITHGGDAPNIIPQFTQMKYEVRAPTTGVLSKLVAKVMSCFEAAAKATGCEIEITNCEAQYENIMSNKCLGKLFRNNAEALSIQFDHNDGEAHGSSDVGNVSHVCPTIQPTFNIGTTFVQHTKGFAAAANSPDAQQSTLTQAKAMMGALIDILTDKTGEIISQLKIDFLNDLENE